MATKTTAIDRADASANDKAHAAQEVRAKKSGIAPKEGGNLTKPKEFADVPDSQWADETNYRYPLHDAAHANNAASRWGDDSNRSQYSSAEQKIISDRIQARQKALGVQSAQDDQDDEEKDRMSTPVIIRADGNHDPFTGKHSHNHPAFGSQGGDATHEHAHEHDGDANHEHSHDDGSETENAHGPDILRADVPETAHLYVPIERIDKQKREIFGRATVEDVDAYRTIFSYDGSKRAFSKWMQQFGNIREMHDSKRAVGKAVGVKFDDDNKQVLVRARVSRSADGDNAWTKIQEGILNGFSVGASQGVWGKIERNGKEYPYLQDYELVELSIVDHPATPGCTIEVARSDGYISDVIEPEDEPEEARAEPAPAPATPDTTRVGARVSADTRTALHKARDHAMQGAKSAMESCNCAECQSAMNALDPDGDGDIDILASLDTDGDGAGGDGSGSGIMNAVKAEITRHLAPTIQRMNGIAARLAATDTTTTTTQTDPELTRRLGDVESKLAGLDEVRSLVSRIDTALSEVKGLAEQIAAQPMPGGPIVNSAALRNQSAADPYGDPLTMETRIVEQLARAGVLNKNQQIDAVLYLERKRAGQPAGR